MSHSIENRYLGELRTHSTHLKSSDTIITDAPVDNNGKGNAFSPTDLVASALCSCMTTVTVSYTHLTLPTTPYV